MTNECYAASCWCAPIRWMCCYKPTSPTHTSVVAQVAVPAMATQLVQPQGHHRQRTWKLSKGKMSYDVSEATLTAPK